MYPAILSCFGTVSRIYQYIYSPERSRDSINIFTLRNALATLSIYLLSGTVLKICLNIPAWMSLMSGDQEADWQVYRIQEFKPIKGGFRILPPLLLTYSRQVPV